MIPVLFVIPKYSLLTLLLLVTAELVVFAFLFFLLRKKYESVRKLRSDLSGYFIFFALILVLLSFFGPFPVRTYGVAVALGFLCALSVASRLAKKVNVDPGMIFDLGMYILIGVIIGSRVFFIIFYDWDYFIQNPMRIFALWEGGLVFYGGLVGGILFALYYVKKKKLDVLNVADVCGVALPLGYFFGRLDCLGYGCCFGRIAPAWFPIKLYFPAIGNPLTGYTPAFSEHLKKGLIDVGATCSLGVYPAQLMESLSGLLLFVWLLFLFPRRRFSGQIASFFLIFYSLIRFLLEFFRVEPTFLGVTTSQWIGVFVFLFGIWLYGYSRKKVPIA